VDEGVLEVPAKRDETGVMGRRRTALSVTVEDDQEWDALVAASPAGEIYHTSRWLYLLQDVFGVQAIRLGLRVGSKLVAGMPILLRQMGPMRLAGSPLKHMETPQMGPLTAHGYEEVGVLDALDALQRSERIGFADITCMQRTSTEPFTRRGYRVQTSQTLHLQLKRDAADMWRGLEGRCRTAIRKANRAGVAVEAATGPDFVRDYQRMVNAVFARQHLQPRHDERYYQVLWNRLGMSGNAQVLLARHQGRLIAGAVFLIHGRRLYYQDGASYPEYHHLCANNLIQWEALQWALGQGLESYDMVGLGTPSIARFKRSFGGSPVEKTRAFRTNTWTAAAAFACYRVWSQMHFFAMTKLR
jgi:hypothetical protein